MVNITPWSPCYSLKWGWVGRRTNLDVLEKKNHFLALPVFELRIFQSSSIPSLIQLEN
jgi:hypothetical protein